MLTISERGAPSPRTNQVTDDRKPVGATALTALERLRRVIQSAPAAIIVASPDGPVVAANREALSLLGLDHLDQLLGTSLADRVVEADRERFRSFTAQVCDGNAATLEYVLATANGGMRSVETRAVPLSRSAGAHAVFLSVTWDVTTRKRAADPDVRQLRARVELLDAQLVAQLEAYEAALKEARAASDHVKQHLAEKRKAIGEAFRRARVRLQTKLAEAQQKYERLAAESDAERESLAGKLRDTEAREASAEALAEDRACQLAILEEQHRASLAARAAETQRLEEALDETRARVARLDEERNEREQMEVTLEEERSQRVALLDQQEHWRVKLSEVLEAMSQYPAPASQSHIASVSHQEASASSGAETNLQSAGESQWEF